ncbi:uncharacterized mitochondrial protein AtMg00810-like [Arachis duranensis]|uniref:Uncharacterized mitochondrial protein AtMg00810-like n=1 Tax=Arachis duranensis TaxID=130453 RepID=A0A6P4CPJ2_ARADU|nr:uncharacterized mitochondrial protein AtMg00810-like [Arachis duranensis]
MDDHSRFTRTFLLKHKFDTVNILINFFNMVETQFKTKVKQMRSDNAALLNHHFKQSRHDYSFFTNGSGHQTIYLLVYVDNTILASPSKDMLYKVHKLLESLFKLKILGDLKYFLVWNWQDQMRKLFLANPTFLPIEPNLRLSSSDGELLTDPASYRRLIGRLMYLTISRPDITYAISTLSQFLSQPRTSHLHALHHLLRYIKGTIGQGLLFLANSEKRLIGYVNVDWAGCLDTRWSVTGFCLFIGNSLVAWRSKKQITVSRSSAESEYWAMVAAPAKLKWLKGLLLDFQVDIPSSMLFCDSQSIIHIASNPTFHERTKHIEVDFHFVREKVVAGFIRPIHVRTQHQLATVFTKPVTPA